MLLSVNSGKLGVKECYAGCAERAEPAARLGTIGVLTCSSVVCGCVLFSIIEVLTLLVVFIVSRVRVFVERE